jgi:hypothetical protein
MGEDDEIEGWKRVWSAIEARLLKIPKSKSDFYRDSLVSPRTFANMRRYGAPIPDVHKRVAICRAVGWTDDSVDRLLVGDDALVIEDQLDREMQTMSTARLALEREPSPENEQRFIESRDRVNDLRELLGRSRIDHRAAPVTIASPANDREFLGQLRDLQDRVAELERTVRELQRAAKPGDAFTSGPRR